MARLDGRVAIVTGAGRGLGKCHALFLAAEGAKVVVNDLGGDLYGGGSDPNPAQAVVDEIRSTGGDAVASHHDVSDWEQSKAMVNLAVETFGDLHVLVNNAGIARDRSLTELSEEDWDLVIDVHLKGHAAGTRHAAAYWMSQWQSGAEVKASVIHTTSVAGFVGNVGQASYASAKLAMLALSAVVNLELGEIGVRSNCVSPAAMTRLALAAPGADAAFKDEVERQLFDPANVSPLIGWLALADCPATGQVYHIDSDRIIVMAIPQIAHRLRNEGRWTLEDLDREVPTRIVPPIELDAFNRDCS